MNVLFDFISIQSFHSGGGEYVKKVYSKLTELNHLNIIGIYDSTLNPLDFNDYKNVQSVDISKCHISDIIVFWKIDVFFIGIIQRYNKYDLTKIKCRVISVIHDIGDIEISYNNIHYLYESSLRNFVRLSVDYIFRKSKYSTINRVLSQYRNIILFLREENVSIITVSNYTLNSLTYFFPSLTNKSISVYYPPSKEYIVNQSIDNPIIVALLEQNVKYLLFLNANRDNKNFNLLHNCFDRIKREIPDIKLVVTGSCFEGESSESVIFLKYVSNSDIEHLYKSSWALIYSSYVEGFGYPPIEAMKYGTPVLASNVCSMTEVLGDSVLYFSPFYVNDLFYRIKYLSMNYELFKLKCIQRYCEIRKKQDSDFQELIDVIIDGTTCL